MRKYFQCRIPRFSVCAAFFSIALITFVCGAKEQEAYISQTFIDTLVQEGYNGLNATEEISRAALTKEEAITRAKGIVKKLKAIAENDRNKKYILWKAGELESQIYLEEKGLLLENDQKREKAVNELIPPFNAELAKSLPDFEKLNRWCEQMRQLGSPKAEDFQSSFDDRRKNISREVSIAIQQAIDRGNFDRAREELAYCNAEREFLDVSQTTIGLLEAKVQSRVSVGGEIAYVNSSLAKGFEDCRRTLLGEARRESGIVEARLSGIKDAVNRREWDKLYFGGRRLMKAIERIEDSLATRGLKLLKEKGVAVATEYSDSVLKKYDLSPEKIAKVNFAILEAAVAKSKKGASSTTGEIVASVNVSKDTASVMDDILAAAKRKALASADSGGPSTERLTFTEKIRLRNMRLAAEGRRQREEQLGKANRDKANRELVGIYTLIEQRKPKEAADHFKEQHALLKEFLPVDAFEKLDSAITARR